MDVTARHAGIGAGGGIVSDAKDTAAFLVALMQGELVDPPWVAAMQGSALWSGGETTACGIAYGWSGAASGYKTNAWVSGDGTRVAVLLLNGRAGGDGDRIAGGILGRLYCAG
jgi:hypothetical protein